MNKTYLFTDPHYGHKNICRGTSEWNPCRTIRDFETIEKMNNAIVESINAIADQDDTLMCLGDWSFGGIENVYTFYCRLVCKNIIFIPGNHDKHIIMDKYLPNAPEGTRASDLFDMKPNIYVFEHAGHKIVVSHFPLDEWEDIHKGSIHFHGHTHGNLDESELNTKYRRKDVYWTKEKGIYLLDDLIIEMEGRERKKYSWE